MHVFPPLAFGESENIWRISLPAYERTYRRICSPWLAKHLRICCAVGAYTRSVPNGYSRIFPIALAIWSAKPSQCTQDILQIFSDSPKASGGKRWYSFNGSIKKSGVSTRWAWGWLSLGGLHNFVACGALDGPCCLQTRPDHDDMVRLRFVVFGVRGAKVWDGSGRRVSLWWHSGGEAVENV